MNRFFKFLCVLVYFMFMIMVVIFLLNNDNEIKLNVNSLEIISKVLYNKLIKFYKFYYDKLGIWDRDDIY